MRVITEPVPSDVRSVALGLWVANGSADETESEAGTSHLLEHMLFRGTPRLSSREIDELFDSIGAEINAATDRETTVLYTRVLDVTSSRPSRRSGKCSSSRPSKRSRPSARSCSRRSRCTKTTPRTGSSTSRRTLYGGNPLGRPVIGKAEVVGAMTPERLRAFHDQRYTAPRLVVAAAGSLEHERIVALAEGSRQRIKQRARRRSAGPARCERAHRAAHALLREGDRTVPRLPRWTGPRPRRRAPLRAARARRRARRNRLLEALSADSRAPRASPIRSSASPTCNGRVRDVGIYLGTRPESLPRGARGCSPASSSASSRTPQTSEEPSRSRENLKGSVALSLESTGARMRRLGAALLIDLPILSLEEMIERIDAVDLAACASLPRACLTRSGSRSPGIGPQESAFRGARQRTVQAECSAAVIRVAVAGAAGRMGKTVCLALDDAPDMELDGNADPAWRSASTGSRHCADVRRRLHRPADGDRERAAPAARRRPRRPRHHGFDPGAARRGRRRTAAARARTA